MFQNAPFFAKHYTFLLHFVDTSTIECCYFRPKTLPYPQFIGIVGYKGIGGVFGARIVNQTENLEKMGNVGLAE